MPSESEPQEIACDPKNSEYIIQFKAKLSLEDGVVVPKIQTASHELKYTP